jgi:hypothetical protein
MMRVLGILAAVIMAVGKWLLAVGITALIAATIGSDSWC